MITQNCAVVQTDTLSFQLSYDFLMCMYIMLHANDTYMYFVLVCYSFITPATMVQYTLYVWLTTACCSTVISTALSWQFG